MFGRQIFLKNNFKFSRIPISEFKKTKFKTDLEKKKPKQIVSQRVPV